MKASGFIVLSKNVLFRSCIRDLIKGVAPVTEVYDSGCFEFDVPGQIQFNNKIIIVDLYSCTGVDEILKQSDLIAKNTIVVILRKDDPVMRYFNMKYGIDKYIFIESPVDQIKEYLRDVYEGDGAIEMKNTKHSLTLREQEILRFVALGKTSKEIGSLLEISKNTVDTHRNKMLHKLNLSNSSELVSFAFRAGLLSDKML